MARGICPVKKSRLGAGWRRPCRSARSPERHLAAALLSVFLAYAPVQVWSSSETALQPGERLSDWMLRQPASGTFSGDPYPAGLSWQRPSERKDQDALRQSVLNELGRPGLEALEPLTRWVRSLPSTGRVVLASTDARWLQANPDQDPRLALGDSLWLPRRPSKVTVLTPQGRWCQVTHDPGAWAADYLAACAESLGSASNDYAWVVQPDGRSRRFGVKVWNEHVQDHPAPGAWIWSPPSGLQVPDTLSDRLARLLGTQGPAPDLAMGDARLVAPDSTSRHPARKRLSPRDPSFSASDWGEIGLLQTPTARMGPAGEARFHWSHIWPYTRGTLMLQPLDGLEAGFRYTDVANREYGPGNPQSYKDKSIDFKLRLMQESSFLPAVSLGVRDIGGTGMFSGEYVVASKRWGHLDASIGLGWGYLGARADLGNPLSLLGSRFGQRSSSSNVHGGTIDFGSLFHGRTALFGGVQWHTPWSGLWLKAEIDGNDYRSEPQNNAQPQRTPVNLGVVWRPVPWVDLSAGVERGTRVMLGLTLHSRLGQLSTPKVMDPPMPRRQATSTTAPSSTDWDRLAEMLRNLTEWELDSVRQDADWLHVQISSANGIYAADRVEKLTALLHGVAPPAVHRFVLHFEPNGVKDVAVVEIDRAQWERRLTEASVPASSKEPLRATAYPDAQPTTSQEGWSSRERQFRWGVSPYYSQVVGGPDGFILFQAGALARARVSLADGLWAQGTLQVRGFDNFEKFRTTGRSGLPPVRTLLREYVTTSRLTLPSLHLAHGGRLGADQFFLAYGGLLEPMFGGMGGEWMWRPVGSPWSLSVDVNRVRQRDFTQRFTFRPYTVTTGHAAIRWKTGWNDVVVSPSIGQYLAGDRGLTLDISREFPNGVAMGAFATKTNVSREAFGEGSFDKGIYVRVPFDAMLARSVTGNAMLLWRPLTRDGGAKLSRPSLEDLTRLRGPDAFSIGPPEPPNARRTGEKIFIDPENRVR